MLSVLVMLAQLILRKMKNKNKVMHFQNSDSIPGPGLLVKNVMQCSASFANM